MKILILANEDNFIYNFKKEMIVTLLERGHTLYISMPHGEKCAKIEELGCILIDTVLDRRGVNPLKDIRLYRTYKKIIREIQPDIVITFTVKCNIYGGLAAKKLGIPYFVNVSGLGTSFQGGLLTKFVIVLYRKAMGKVEKVFFENEENQQVFIDNHIILENKAVLLNGSGVNLDEFSFKEMVKRDEVIILFVGRLMKEKGVDELLEVAKRCYLEKLPVQFELIGRFEENYKEKMDEYQKNGYITYYGFQNNVKDFIERCSCVVLPSYHEGLSNTLLEGASMGRPLITSNIPGCRETVIEGETGFLVNRKDSEDLYQKIKQFIALPFEKRQQMGIQSRKFIEKKYNRFQIIEKTLEAMNIH